MRSDRASRRVFLALLFLGLVVGSTLVACRELTAPTQENPEMIRAFGFVHDVEMKPVIDAQVVVRLDDDRGRRAFEGLTYTDERGRFEIWIPNQEVSLRITPPSGSEAPEFRDEHFRFSPGVEASFPLLGAWFAGSIDAGGLEHVLAESHLTFAVRIARSGGSTQYVESTALLNEGGGFEVRLPQEGSYRVVLRGYEALTGFYWWPDSLQVSRGDSIRLVLPLVEITVEPMLHGDPLPASELGRLNLTAELDPPSGPSSNIGRDWDGDGTSRGFSAAVLRGSQVVGLYPKTSFDEWVPRLEVVPPIRGGEVFPIELGLHELRILIQESTGQLIDVSTWLHSENSGINSAYQRTTSPDRRYWVNPGGHRLEVSASGYPYQYLYFTVQGDTTITVQMVPIEYPDGLELDRPALPQSP